MSHNYCAKCNWSIHGNTCQEPLNVGEFVESFACVRSKKPIITLTPQRDGSIGYFGPSAQEDFTNC